MADQKIGEEVKDLKDNVALGMLSDLQKAGKITMETQEQFKKKYIRLHDTISQTFQNHKILLTKAKKLKNELHTEKYNLENAQTKQSENAEKAEQLNADIKKTDTDLQVIEHLLELREMELQSLLNDELDKNEKIKKEKQDVQKRIQPQLDKEKIEIEVIKEEILAKQQKYEDINKNLNENNEKINFLFKDNENCANEIQEQHTEFNKIKEEPNRFKRNADNLQEAKISMNNEVLQNQDELNKKEKQIQQQQEDIQKQQKKTQDIEEAIELHQKQKEGIEIIIQNLISKTHELTERHSVNSEDKVAYETELKKLIKEIRRHNDNIGTLKKEIEIKRKQYKKVENQKIYIKNQFRELEIAKIKLRKEQDNVVNIIHKQGDEQVTVEEDIKLIEQKRRMVQEKTSDRLQKKKQIEESIQDIELSIQELQKVEQTAQKTVKNLTAMRESMARKASAAMAEVRETREELKIKELLILDFKKKQQETEFKLNQYKNLYEEVKSARNKYVNMIQSSSQDLAELKEQIKIMQNELEILKNESSEKDRTLIEYKHILQIEIHKRDRRHAKLNKLEYVKRQKKELVDQNINEIEKLLMIISSLESDMMYLKKQYESVCENRNYTGIQLIDRNDELCILYEKQNIQENILKNGETEIKKLEDEIRMINIENNEAKRKINVARNKIDNVPKLADSIIALKNELDLEKEKEQKLSEELENPENEQRWRPLEGTDAEQESLDAKIQVLEERLNSKKEILLEKELILDEITNLSEKLRKQAIDGRQVTLELSERVNEYQARLKDLTRKMMATLSELSMFQASALKLQNEREELEKIVENAKIRAEQQLAPIPEAEIEYLKMIRDQKRYEEEREFRKQRELIERNIPPFATKTTAEHRVNAYIPDEIGIPKPYGKHAPFKPSEIGVNIRHFKKPQVKEIEI